MRLLPRSEHPVAAGMGFLNENPTPQTQPANSNSPISESPLKGIRFGPMTAPGPSGRRDEHIRELLSIRRRSVANRLLRLIGEAVKRGLEGSLPPAARWILGSGMTFLEKPGKDAPRPIRAGEWLREVIGKSLLLRHKAVLAKLMVELHQYGVAMPNGTEILFHARDTVEQLAREGQLPPIAIIDVDLVSCFGSFERALSWRHTKNRFPRLYPGSAGALRRSATSFFLRAKGRRSAGVQGRANQMGHRRHLLPLVTQCRTPGLLGKCPCGMELSMFGSWKTASFSRIRSTSNTSYCHWIADSRLQVPRGRRRVWTVP